MTRIALDTDAFPIVPVDAYERSPRGWRLRSVTPCTCGERHEWNTSGPLENFAVSDDCPERPFVEVHTVSVVRLPGRSVLDRMVTAITSRQHHAGLLRVQVGATGA